MNSKNIDEEDAGLWQSEWISSDILEFYKISNIIYNGKTKYQKVTILETLPYGKCLLLDNKIQSSLKDEYIYHETLVHPSIVMHGDPKRVVVIGGGEGATVREVTRWRNIEEIMMIEIDKEVIDICSIYMSELNKDAYKDKRLRIIIEDGRKWLSSQPNNTIDVLIIDVTDPLEGGPSYLLYTKEFYELAMKKLTPNGILATQATSPIHNEFVYSSIKKTLSTVFKYVVALHAYVKSYSSLWGFLFASNKNIKDISSEDINSQIKNKAVTGLKFYSGDLHYVMRCMAEKYEQLLGIEGRIIADDSPIFIK